MKKLLIFAIAGFILVGLFGFNSTGNTSSTGQMKLIQHSPDSGRWVLATMLADTGLLTVPGDRTYLQFDPIKGTVAGNGGCNHYGGKYELAGDKIKIEQVFSTKMFCADQSITEQNYFQLLGQADRFIQEANQLNLYQEAGYY